MKSRLILFIFIVIILLVACVPVGEVSTPSQAGNMKLLAQEDEVQIWKLVDMSTVCYITINSMSYEPAGIFCLK